MKKKSPLSSWKEERLIKFAGKIGSKLVFDQVKAEISRRILKSQTPKWINYLMLGITIIILLLTFYMAFIK